MKKTVAIFIGIIALCTSHANAQSLLERYAAAQEITQVAPKEYTPDSDGKYTLHFIVTGKKPAKISVDGKEVGETTDGSLDVKITPGDHSYKIKLPGHKAGKGHISVPDDGATVSMADKMIGKKIKYIVLLHVPPVWAWIWIGPKLYHINSQITYEQAQVWID